LINSTRFSCFFRCSTTYS